MMQIPCLEVLGGRLVTCAGGPDDAVMLAEDPVRVARELARQGAVFFQVVDLDGVYGTGDNDEVLARMVERMLPFQVGGGVRTPERVEALMGLGADRVVVGSMFSAQPDEAGDVVKVYGRRVLASVEERDGKVLVDGRADEAGEDVGEVLARVAATGVEGVVYASLEGDRPGSGVEGLRRVLQGSELDVYGCVGVRDRDALQAVKALGDEDGVEGLVGVVLGAEYWGGAVAGVAEGV